MTKGQIMRVAIAVALTGVVLSFRTAWAEGLHAIPVPGSGVGAGFSGLTPAMAAAAERVRAKPGPPDEVFALIRLTDRDTGAVHVLTRGEADPRLGRYIQRPETAPPGRSYVNVELFEADGGVEIATRSIRVRNVASFERATTREEERERDLLRRNGQSPFGPRIEAGLRGLIESGAVRLDADAGQGLTPVMISLKEIPRLSLPKAHDPEAAGLLWTGLDVAAARERAIIDRKRQVADIQAPVVRAVEQRGGVVDYASWMSGLVQTKLPGAAIRALAEHPSVHSLEFIPRAQTLGHYFEGDDIFIATNAQDFDINHQGHHGHPGKHPITSRVFVAMGEQCPDETSPAWRTGGPGSANRGIFYDCDPPGCSLGGIEKCWDDPAVGNNWPPHGHFVAGVMAGDLMDGQIPALTGVQRRRITGTCPECRLLFMQDEGLDDRPAVHDLACEKAVDVFEESLGWTSGTLCDGEGFMDDSVEGLVDCDVVYVNSAGNTGNSSCDQDCCNDGPSSGCTTLYPADHPWTFAVSGMDTEDPCDTPGEYYTNTCQFDNCSSRGGGTYNGNSGSASIVDLAGPWRMGNGIEPGTVTGGGFALTGTSFAAPAVAGLMAEMMDWYKIHVGHAMFHNNRMRTFMLLFGDRSSGFSGSTQSLGGFDIRWGAGRVGLVPFDDLPGVTLHSLELTLAKNQSYTIDLPLLPSGTFYKAVLWHDGKDYADEPRVDLTIDPLGCGAGTATWKVHDSKALLAHPWVGGCDDVRVTIKNTGVGSSGTRTFYFYAYSIAQNNERSF
jgi:hypothetical protein